MVNDLVRVLLVLLYAVAANPEASPLKKLRSSYGIFITSPRNVTSEYAPERERGQVGGLVGEVEAEPEAWSSWVTAVK